MALIKAPELEDRGGIVGAFFKVGDATIWVFDVEEDADQQGRTIITGHDDNGDEVEVRFHPDNEEDE